MPKNLEKEEKLTDICEKDWEIIDIDPELRYVKVVQEFKDNSYDMLEDIGEINQEKSASTTENKPSLSKTQIKK